MTTPRPFTIQPNVAGSTLRLVSYVLPGDTPPDLDDILGFAAELEGEVVGAVIDRTRPDIVQLQIEEASPPDLSWARRVLLRGMARSVAVLQELPDGGAIFHGRAAICAHPTCPWRIEFALRFRPLEDSR